jgi:ribonuclease P protein component
MRYKVPTDIKLRTAQQFKKAFSHAKKLSSDKYYLLFKVNNLDYPRLGILIAKKNVAKATSRNRLRRKVKESFRLHQHQIKGYDVLFIAYKSLDELNNEELRQCLEKQWQYLAKHQARS